MARMTFFSLILLDAFQPAFIEFRLLFFFNVLMSILVIIECDWVCKIVNANGGSIKSDTIFTYVVLRQS